MEMLPISSAFQSFFLLFFFVHNSLHPLRKRHRYHHSFLLYLIRSEGSQLFPQNEVILMYPVTFVIVSSHSTFQHRNVFLYIPFMNLCLKNRITPWMYWFNNFILFKVLCNCYIPLSV